MAAADYLRKISKADALEIAQRQFAGRDVDYYIREDGSLSSWTVFVDAEPLTGWEHECYLLTIPKTTITTVERTSPTRIEELMCPPAENYSPLSVKSRYENDATSKPAVAKAPPYENPEEEGLEAARRTHAVILSGGMNKNANSERYWNDCSFIYQTLANKYHIPKEQIHPIMADGNDPAEDMTLIGSYEKYSSQSLDLDFDGVDEIELAATKDNLKSVISRLTMEMNEEDHLFLFVTDHGGRQGYTSTSYIWLWGEGQILYDYELAGMLAPIVQKGVYVNVVLGQCYSGGFVEELAEAGCLVATSCTESEKSYGRVDVPFDEFIYKWTCAVNGADHKKNPLNADTNHNGRISMQEAFIYAESHDMFASSGWNKEHPQYVSSPISVGEDLAFNYIPPAVDLYVMDNWDDTGVEPNSTTELFWDSPSIWVRNFADGKREHENPYHSAAHTAAIVYVRVHNRGKKAYNGDGKHLHLYWARASTGFRPDTWIGNELDSNGEVTGGALTPVKIPAIPAGEYRDVAVSWNLPENLPGTSAGEGGKHHFCLLAKIMDTHISEGFRETFSYNCRNSNDDASKNVSVIDCGELSEATSVFVRNVSDTTQHYSLELVPRDRWDAGIFETATITMEMSEPILNGWERGGSRGRDIRLVPAIGTNMVQLLSQNSRVEDISLETIEFGKVGLKFNFRPNIIATRKFTVDLIQRDEYGTILGGETFLVESPYTLKDPIPVTPITFSPGMVRLEAETSPNSYVRWEDREGRIVGQGEMLEVKPSANSDNTYYVYGLTEDGGVAEGGITLESEMGFKRVVLDGSKSWLHVEIKGDVQKNSLISISSASSGGDSLTPLAEGENSTDFDVSSLPPGIYTISLIWRENIVATWKFIK